MQLKKEQYEEVIERVVKAILRQEGVDKKVVVKSTDVIPVEVSARHVHLSIEAMEAIFGKGYRLTKKRELSQIGEFLSEERVTLVGKKGVLENVAVLGPLRKSTQVEVTISDCRKLGLDAMVRDSGDINGTPGVTIVGVDGAVTINQGVVVARRHIHMTPQDAVLHKVKDGDLVQVAVKGTRPLIFGDVLIRVSDKFALAMHIDTEEANVCGLGKNGNACIVDVKAQCNNKPMPEEVQSVLSHKETPENIVVFTGKLLTEHKLSEYKQKKHMRIQVAKKTIITALACDYAKKYHIAIVRSK